MKKIIKLLIPLLITIGANAQIKKPKITKHNPIKTGIELQNINELTTDALSKAKIPAINVAERIKNARPLTSWKIEPLRPKDNWLYLDGPYYGWYSQESWTLVSRPRIEGTELTGYYGSSLFLKFRQSKDIEYRMKIKLKTTSWHRGKHLHIQVNDFSGRYPIDPNNGTVTVGWTASRSQDKASIVIGQIIMENVGTRRPFPETIITGISIDKI